MIKGIKLRSKLLARAKNQLKFLNDNINNYSTEDYSVLSKYYKNIINQNM